MKGKSKINVYQDTVQEGETEPKSTQRALMDVIIETITKCSDEFDDTVQLQVMNSMCNSWLLQLMCHCSLRS